MRVQCHTVVPQTLQADFGIGVDVATGTEVVFFIELQESAMIRKAIRRFGFALGNIDDWQVISSTEKLIHADD